MMATSKENFVKCAFWEGLLFNRIDLYSCFMKQCLFCSFHHLEEIKLRIVSQNQTGPRYNSCHESNVQSLLNAKHFLITAAPRPSLF